LTLRFDADVVACAASQATSPHPPAFASSATARTAKRSRIFSIVRTCSTRQAERIFFHMPPGRVKLTAGTDALRCLCLSNKVLRWYTECCRTPIANTPTGPGFPVIGVIHSFMNQEGDSRSRDEVLGPPLCRIYERSAVGPLPPNGPGPPSVGVFARRASMMLAWWVHGLGWPTPLFDDRTKAPRAVPHVLTRIERAAL
jgi:Family of unknown function (DUF6151)